MTLQVYLNHGFEGGTTRFLGMMDWEYADAVPVTGSVVVFEVMHKHALSHA